jgi:hypothetical protein
MELSFRIKFRWPKISGYELQPSQSSKTLAVMFEKRKRKGKNIIWGSKKIRFLFL